MLTPTEFEEEYAARSGVTVNFMRQHNRTATPCYCGADECEGWQMAHVETPDDKDTALRLWRRWADENLPPKP